MDNKVLFAKKCIAESLIGLMNEKEYQEISVTEICDRAGYSRMSYYRNFSGKDDILRSYMKMLVDEFRKASSAQAPHFTMVTYEHLVFAFRYFRNYSYFMECLLKANLSAIIQYGLNYYMDTYFLAESDDISKRYRMYYYAGGLCNLFTVWISNGMKESEEEMAQIVFDRFNHPSYSIRQNEREM